MDERKKRTTLKHIHYVILVEFLRIEKNYENLFGAGRKTVIGGKYKPKKNASDLAASELKTQGFPDTKGDCLYKQYHRYMKKHRETQDWLASTGAGLTEAEYKKGITIAQKVEKKCPHFYVFDELMRDKPHVDPPAKTGNIGFQRLDEQVPELTHPEICSPPDFPDQEQQDNEEEDRQEDNKQEEDRQEEEEYDLDRGTSQFPSGPTPTTATVSTKTNKKVEKAEKVERKSTPAKQCLASIFKESREADKDAKMMYWEKKEKWRYHQVSEECQARMEEALQRKLEREDRQERLREWKKEIVVAALLNNRPAEEIKKLIELVDVEAGQAAKIEAEVT
jgi:hypothetical protein